MKTVVFLALSVLALPALAQDLDTFMGITYGKSISATLKECKSDSDPETCYYHAMYDDPTVFQVKRHNNGGTISVTQEDSAVVYSDLGVRVNELAQYREALIAKFGQPVASGHSVAENLYGAHWPVATLLWSHGDLVIALSDPSSFTGEQGDLKVFTRPYLHRIQGEKSAQAQKIAGDF